MRRLRRWSIVAAALAVLLLWWGLGGEPAAPAPQKATAGASHGGPAPAAVRAEDSDEWTIPTASPETLALPGGTPPLRHPATESDGHLEVVVTAGGAPVPSAKVRVYLRGPRDPRTARSQWRFAGGGETDVVGRLRVAARPGTYLVAVRKEGFAASRREVLRPAGEAVTHVTFTLERGTSLNGRVVEARSGEPVPLTEVSLSRFAMAGSGRSDSPLEEAIAFQADPRGRFAVAGIEPGTYHLEATAPGHQRLERSVTVPRLEELVLELGGASTVEGRVLTSGGVPAAGAEVTFVGEEVIRTMTGPEGTFAAEVHPGLLAVSARLEEESGSLPERVPVAVGQTVRDLVIRLGKAAAITGVVRAAADQSPIAGAKVLLSPHGGDGELGRAMSGADGAFTVASVAPGPYDVEAFADGYSPFARRGVTVAAGQSFPLVLEMEGSGRIRGVIRDGTGAPLAGVLVQAVRMWGHSTYLWGETHETITGADGTYAIGGVEVGPRVRVTAGRSGELWLASQVVPVRASEVSVADFTLRGTGVVSGRVLERGGAGIAEDVVVRAAADSTGADRQIVPVGVDGSYRLELPAGRYTLQASTTEAPLRTSVRTGLVVEPGSELTRILELAPSAPEIVAEGIVLHSSGAPAPGAWVQLSSIGPGGKLLWGQTVSCDAWGRFQMAAGTRPPPERFETVARQGGGLARLSGVRRGDRDVRLVLEPGGSLSGRVQGLGEAESFRVSVRAVDESLLPWVGGDEREFAGTTFALSEVPATALRVTVRTEAGRTGSAIAHVPSGGTASVTVVLEGGASIAGRAVSGNAPVAGAWVDLLSTGVRLQTTSDGRFTLPQLPAGLHSLTIWAPGYVRAERTLTLRAGEDLQLGEVELARQTAEPGTIGVRWGEQDGEVVASSVLPDGPADLAQLRRGDIVTEIDGVRVATAREAEAKSNGAPGSQVLLRIRRPDGTLVVPVQRASGTAPPPLKATLAATR